MVSQVFFTMDDQPTVYQCRIHQDAGENFSFETSPLLLTPPNKLIGVLHYEDFRVAVKKYYRMCVGTSAIGIRAPGGSNLTMKNNRFGIMLSVQVRGLHDSDDGAWPKNAPNLTDKFGLFKGQFVGMHDVKGNPLHEGASVKFYYKGENVICKIIYVPEWAMFCLQWSDGYKNKFPMIPENYEVV